MKNNLHKDTTIPALPLLPCPFCGGPARLEYTEVPDFGNTGKRDLSWHVECGAPLPSKCPGKHWLTSSAEKAVAGWNTRVNAEVSRRAGTEK